MASEMLPPPRWIRGVIARNAVFFCLIASLWLPASAVFGDQSVPRVAVWNPVKGTREPPNRFVLDLSHLDQVTHWLKQAGIGAQRLTSAQINDPGQFSSAKYDALMLPGDSFPRINTQALQRFADEGGILIALQGRTPFVVGIAQGPDGLWTMSPKTPAFAWQSSDILGHFGARYIHAPAKHDKGVFHSATPLLKKYLSIAAGAAGALDIRQPLPSLWIVPSSGGGRDGRDGRTGAFYPLVRSRRVDGADVTPQVFIARSGNRRAIISLSPIFTQDADPKLWPVSRETVIGLARLARDLRAGMVTLTPEMKIDLPEDLPPPEPLRARLPTGSVEPEDAAPLARWGRFDGSSLELGEPLAAGESRDVGQKAPEARFPRALAPRASVRLALPARPAPGDGPRYLRVRGAFTATGAGLRADVGATTVWNETFRYVDAGGSGNYSSADLGDVPAEFHRIVFLPPSAGAAALTLSNPGDQPLYFDAVQIETRTAPPPRMVIGPMLIDLESGAGKIPTDLSRQWNLVRANIRTQQTGPPSDSERFARNDVLFARFAATGAPIHLLLEGTPEWAAISPERYAQGKAAGRPHVVPPDPQKYAEIVEQMIRRYGERVDAYEIWNETDIAQFWRGTPEEYAQLCKTIVPIIRRLDPSAKVVSAGMAGYKEAYVDMMIRSGVFSTADWVGFHPYAGKSPGWDVSFGLLEGKLFSAGVGAEIYCNESGFVWKAGEWFQGSYSPEIQRRLLEIAMGRLLASKLAKLNIFNVGGTDHHFDLFDAAGAPRPAYHVFADYLPLGHKGGRRLDIAMVPAGDAPLHGLYSAAASHDDGSVTVILNPAESPLHTLRVTLGVPLRGPGDYRGAARTGSRNRPVEVSVRRSGKQTWARVTLDITGRTVVTLTP